MSNPRCPCCGRMTLLLVILTLHGVARADTHHVKAGGDIQAAVDAAEDGDVVQMAAGTYSIATPILVKKAITLQGAGANKTTLDAESRCRVVTLQGPGTVKGFTITGGKARAGAGIHCKAGATVADCTIAKNVAERFGGGVEVRVGNGKGAAVLVENCRILDNKVTDYVHTDYPFGGGGIYVDLNTTVRNCRIEGNEAAQRGGGVWCHNSSCVIENCTITGNRAWGKRRRNPNGSGSMEEGGGGAFCDFGGRLQGCLITGNHADRIGGGAILSTGARARNCTIVANTAVLRGAGVLTFGPAGLINTIAHGNTRGALPKESEKPDAAKRPADDVYVSHYYHVDVHQLMLGKVHVKNCSIGQTTLHVTRQRFYLGRTAGYDASRYKNTVIEAGAVAGDPGFVDAAKHDYRLKPGSPCIDAGTSEDWMKDAKDLADRPRLQGAAPDIGAYEIK
jgi:hypothetical protein